MAPNEQGIFTQQKTFLIRKESICIKLSKEKGFFAEKGTCHLFRHGGNGDSYVYVKGNFVFPLDRSCSFYALIACLAKPSGFFPDPFQNHRRNSKHSTNTFFHGIDLSLC